jgi:glycosyltransferase involved in cell wall biosynthesis
MWKNKTVSVILPTYNEKDSIARVINDYFNTGFVDEVIVVNNNAVAGTAEVVAATKAKQVFEPNQGYGNAIRRGFQETKCDFILISEPDGTFTAKDIVKFLAYIDDYAVVWGTRTDTRFIGDGANMGLAMRLGNIAVAKLLQLLFDTTRISDVGCTLKLYRREVIEDISRYFRVGREHFGAELMVLTALKKFDIVEIPVQYNERVGKSSVTGYPLKTACLALKMVGLILRYYLEKIRGRFND